ERYGAADGELSQVLRDAIADDSLPSVGVRGRWLFLFRKGARDGIAMSTVTRDFLGELAVSNSDRRMREAAFAALVAYGETPPFRAFLGSDKHQKKAIAVVWMVLVAVFAIVGLTALGVCLFGKRLWSISRRVFAAVGWLGFSAVVAAAGAFPVLGMVLTTGRTSVRTVLEANAPFFVGMIGYVLVAWWVFFRGPRKPASSERSINVAGRAD
ncbi:MAG: hypothetical protein K0U93_17535, partial [Gammaproteobacteria bacterium]|nr:hypothetical protein [Gammaproteobacteria bacterium]